MKNACRPSCEGRGLKCQKSNTPNACHLSSLMRGTWIEIMLFEEGNIMDKSSLMRGTWIEIRQPERNSRP